MHKVNMQNNPPNTLSIKNIFDYKKDPERLKLSLLKQKRKSPKAKKLDTSNSSNENTILKYYPKTSKNINDKYSLNAEDATLEQLIFKTKRVKLVSGSDDNNPNTSKLTYEDYQGYGDTERSQLVKPSKLRKMSESDAPKNAFNKVLNSPESLVESDSKISKSINNSDVDPKPYELIAKGPKKQRKLYSESILDNTDMEKHSEIHHINKTVPDHILLKDKGPKLQRRKSCSQLVFDVTNLEKERQVNTSERDSNQNQFIDKVSKKRKRSESIFDETNLERNNDSFKSIDECEKGVITESPRLVHESTKKEKRKSVKIKNKVTVNNSILESDLSSSKLNNEDYKGVDGMEMSQLSVKQLKKRQISKSCSSPIKTVKKVCKQRLNTQESISDLTDFTETSKIDFGRNQLYDKLIKKRRRKSKSKAIIDDDSDANNMRNDTDSSKLIDEDGKQIDKTRSSQLVAEKSKKEENLNSNKLTLPKYVVNNSESAFQDFNDFTQTSNSIMTIYRIEQTSISNNENNSYEENKEQNQLIVEQAKKQETNLNKSSLKDTLTCNEPEQPNKGGRPKLDSSITNSTKKVSKKSHKSTLKTIHNKGIDTDAFTLFVKDDQQESVEQPKKRGRPRSYSVIDTTPKTATQKELNKSEIIINQNNHIQTAFTVVDKDTFTLFDKDDKQESIKQPKKRGRPRSYSVIDTTPKTAIQKDLNKSESIVNQNNPIQTAFTVVDKDTFTLFDKDGKQESVKQPKKRGRPRSYSVIDTTPKIAIQKDLNNSESIVNQDNHIQTAFTVVDKDTFTVFDKDGKQESVKQPKKRGRPRLDSSKARTPKKITTNDVEGDMNKDDKHESAEQRKRRGRPRLCSVKDTTPKITIQKESKKSGSVLNQTKEVSLNNSELDNCDINANKNREHESVSENERTSVSPDLLQPLDVQPIKKGKVYATKTVTPRTASKTKKINLAKTKRAMLKPNGKITKESLKATSFRKIPQNRLENALEMLRNEDHPVWEDHNISCNTGIFRYWEPRNCIKSDRNLKIKYARQFLLRRDWINLSKVLSLSTSNVNTNRNNHYYPLLTKYATLCLAHTDKEQFDKFVQFLVGLDDGSGTSVIKKCTNIINENVE